MGIGAKRTQYVAKVKAGRRNFAMHRFQLLQQQLQGYLGAAGPGLVQFQGEEGQAGRQPGLQLPVFNTVEQAAFGTSCQAAFRQERGRYTALLLDLAVSLRQASNG